MTDISTDYQKFQAITDSATMADDVVLLTAVIVGAETLTLPKAANCTGNNSQKLVINDLTSGAVLSIVAQSGDSIVGVADCGVGDGAVCQSDGYNKWYIIRGSAGVGASVTEAELAFSDITTRNATASLHGLMPKLSGDAADVFRGDGTQAPVTAAEVGLGDVDDTSDVDKPVSTAQQAAIDAEAAQRLGNTANYVRTTTGAQTLLAANAVARSVIILVRIVTTFAAGDGAAPIYDFGETDTVEKFKADLTTGTAGDLLVYGGTLAATKALLVTATAATGATSTGAIEVTALALPQA